MGEVEKVKSLLASERVARDFGLASKPTVRKSEPEVKEVEPEPEESVVEDTPKSTGMDKFLAAEKVQSVRKVRNLIQDQVNQRMQETENEQFDIEWDTNNPQEDLRKWKKTLAKFGRNTKDIDAVLKLIEEIDNG